ncbi:MAG: 16S rRNA (uracil(1498)-N(3))-methyltransferase [Phycisphaeraceae bacterium]|nr:16S rRNA (uracil(1498)-N(3))-methyltransferase [Phycisphaeraceae bacterium]
MHRLWVPELRQAIDSITIHGDEADHLARARRARPGEPIALHDGQGRIATGSITRIDPGSRREPPSVTVQLDLTHLLPPGPAVHVLTAVPKGGRVDEMVEQLSQIGARSWSPLRCARSVVDPRPTKLNRLERIAVESMKQCGRAWRLHVADHTTDFAEAFAASKTQPPPATILAHSAGTPALNWFLTQRAHADSTPTTTLRLLIGPEGGWTPDELAAAHTHHAAILSFGPHAMRIETAAVVAASLAVQALTT